MIQFSLKCDKGHRFDSWFQSSAAFDKLMGAGMVTCSVCGSPQVEKAVMAPRIADSRGKKDAATAPTLAPDPQEAALAEFKRKVEEKSEYVGLKFAQEARDMHDGLTPERPIYGEAKPEEAVKLLEEGVPVAPLPFTPGRKSN